MSRRHSVGGLSIFIVSVVLCCVVSCARASNGVQQTDSFLARRKICLYVDLQKEFDKTVEAVKEVLNFADVDQQAKLNHTIYKGLLNHMIGQSVYLNDIQNGLPKADDKVVEKLEEAGFVVLANLAKKDYSFAVDAESDGQLVPTQHAGTTSRSGTGNQPQDGKHIHHTEGDNHNGVSSSPLQTQKYQGITQEESDQAKSSPSETGLKTSSITTTYISTSITSPCDINSPHIEGKNQYGVSSNKHRHPSISAQTHNCQTTTEAGLDPMGKRSSTGTSQRGTPNHPTSQDYSNFGPDSNERNQRRQPSIPTSVDPTRPEVAPAHGQGTHGNEDSGRRLVNKEGSPIVEDDLYWSTEIEAAIPKGFSQHELDEWKHRLSTQTVHSFEPGSLTKCGREKNRFIVLDDGSKLCVRYRYPLITSMTGELYSYHLARMLGITNLPPLHVTIATANSRLWLGQSSNFQQAEWEDGKAVLLTKWIEDLDDAFFPETLIQGPFPVGALNSGLRNLTTRELTSLVQWSDLLLFDYLIAHFDRLTINLSSVRHYNDTSLMRSQVHNLVQHPHTKQLWIVDNESGLLDGYSFLLVEGNKDSLLQGVLHEELLRKICIFRRSTVERVRALFNHPNPAKLLSDRVRREDPASEGFFPALDQIQGHSRVLKERLGKIHRWTQECQQRNSADKKKQLSKLLEEITLH